MTPTPWQKSIISRAYEAPRGTAEHKRLWRLCYAIARAMAVEHKASSAGKGVQRTPPAPQWEERDFIEYVLCCTPESPSAGNTVALDDLITGFRTIAQESGSVVLSLDNLEEYGDTYEACWEEEHLDQELQMLLEQERLESLMDWEGHTGTKQRPLHGLHPVTQERDLPDWLAHEVDSVGEEDHLEPAFLGFEGLNQPLPV